jgi:hypothetical protein
MSNGGLSGISAGAVNFPAPTSSGATEKSRQVESEKISGAGDSATAAETPRTTHSTGKTLNVAA